MCKAIIKGFLSFFYIFLFVSSILLVGSEINKWVAYLYSNNPEITHVPVLAMAIISFIFWLFTVLVLVAIVVVDT